MSTFPGLNPVLTRIFPDDVDSALRGMGEDMGAAAERFEVEPVEDAVLVKRLARSLEAIYVPGPNGSKIRAELDIEVSWRQTFFVPAEFGREWFQIVVTEPWMIVESVTDQVYAEAEEMLASIAAKRLSDTEEVQDRIETTRLFAMLETMRTEHARMQTPIEREPARQTETRLDRSVHVLPVEPGKTLVEVHIGSEHKRVLDPSGNVVASRSRSIDTLATLRRNGTIEAEDLVAGRAFHRAFMAAQLSPLRAPAYGRVGTGKAADMADHVVAAQQRVAAAIILLGGHQAPVAAAVWAIAGEGKTLTEFAASRSWGSSEGAGRPLKPETARELLIGGLRILADEWMEQDPDCVPAQRHATSGAAS